MCGKIRAQRQKPGDIMAFWSKSGKASGTWGFENGRIYNARSESLETYWKSCGRGYIEVDCFWEKNQKIVSKDGKLIKLAVVFNNSMEFAIITREAQGFLIGIHHRIPVILESEQQFLEGGEIVEFPFSELKIAA